MAHDDLRDWIKVLDKAGELKRIREEVDPILEIAEITDRVCKIGRQAKSGGAGKYAPGGPALLFERVKGYPGAKVLMNQFGSERRMKLALNVDSLDEISRADSRVHGDQVSGRHAAEAEDAADAGGGGEVLSEDHRCARCAVQGSDLARRIQMCWIFRCCSAGRGMADGSSLCLGVITRDPKTNKRNMGMYRMQVYDGQTTGMHWQRQKIAAEHLRQRLRAAAAAGARRRGGSACFGYGGDGGRDAESWLG